MCAKVDGECIGCDNDVFFIRWIKSKKKAYHIDERAIGT